MTHIVPLSHLHFTGVLETISHVYQDDEITVCIARNLPILLKYLSYTSTPFQLAADTRKHTAAQLCLSSTQFEAIMLIHMTLSFLLFGKQWLWAHHVTQHGMDVGTNWIGWHDSFGGLLMYMNL